MTNEEYCIELCTSYGQDLVFVINQDPMQKTEITKGNTED